MNGTMNPGQSVRRDSSHSGLGGAGSASSLHVRRDHDKAVESLRVVGGQQHRRVHSPGRSNERRVLDPRGVEYRERVGCVEWKVVAVLRPVTGAGPSRVVGDDRGVRLEGGDLVPDNARIDEVPRRHEQNRPLATAVPVPGDPRSIGARRHAIRTETGSRDHALTITLSHN